MPYSSTPIIDSHYNIYELTCKKCGTKSVIKFDEQPPAECYQQNNKNQICRGVLKKTQKFNSFQAWDKNTFLDLYTKGRLNDHGYAALIRHAEKQGWLKELEEKKRKQEQIMREIEEVRKAKHEEIRAAEKEKESNPTKNGEMNDSAPQKAEDVVESPFGTDSPL